MLAQSALDCQHRADLLMDVHKATVSVTVASGGRSGEVRQLGTFANRPDVLRKLVGRLTRGGGMS
jgi:hypothetical protein